MATPQYNIKTGADSSAFFSREVTQTDIANAPDAATKATLEAGSGLIQNSVEGQSDVFEYPVLVRRTGDSFKGTTESIESNELRKGRTKSAPRKGNSSSEGSLDFELSPETYDDILEATLRNHWKKWVSDSKVTQDNGTTDKSATNLDNDIFADGYFASKQLDANGKVKDVARRLYATKTEALSIYNTIKAAHPDWSDEKIKSDPTYPVIITDAQVEVAELTCGTDDIRYDVVKQFGGVEGDDLYQDFQHNCVNTLDMSVTPGQIVTGSFGFMGSNNPDMVNAGLTKDGKYIQDNGDGTTSEVDTLADETKATGLIKVMKDRFLNVSASGKPATAKNWVDNLPEKGTSTDQYTAREGFLYISGERVRYGSTLSFNLNNGLEKTFAIFEKDAISMSPLSLDITGSLGAYLIKGYTETLYNMATGDKDVEVLFCFQDKEEDPENLYVVQIFKTKFTDTDISSGAENLEVTFPFQSFEERAMRILRVRTVRPKKFVADSFDGTKVDVALSSAPTTATVTATVTVDGTTQEAPTVTYSDGVATVTFAETVASGKTAIVKVTCNGKTLTGRYTAE